MRRLGMIAAVTALLVALVGACADPSVHSKPVQPSEADVEPFDALGTGRHLADYLGGSDGISLLIRTDFSDDAAWRRVASAAMAPGEGDDAEFAANLTCIDNAENDGMSIATLLDMIGDEPPYYAFIADSTTITDHEHPILAVDTEPEAAGGNPTVRGRTVRVLPSKMWAIENNLAISNMDFDDFLDGAGPDGIYRGF